MLSLLTSGLLLVGIGLELWVVAALGWRRALALTDEPPDAALPRLVLGGPFRWVRHPQVLGLLCLVAAAALRWPRPIVWGATLLVAALLVAAAQRAERACAARFGDAYERYRRVVPFLLPNRCWSGRS